jgi:hypothetical protein
MRCNPRLHRAFANLNCEGKVIDGSKYPTRLKEGEVDKHDDWSCLEDAVAMGFVEMWWQDHSGGIIGGARVKVKFTPEGQRVVGDLRAHKANGGTFHTFTVPEDVRWQEKTDEFLAVLR